MAAIGPLPDITNCLRWYTERKILLLGYTDSGYHHRRPSRRLLEGQNRRFLWEYFLSHH